MAPKLTRLRPQPYRLKWPLTSTQLESIDEMLEILFKRVKELSALVNTTSTTSVSTTNPTFIMMDFGSGGDGDGEMGPPGLPGPAGSSVGGGVSYVPVSTGAEPLVILSNGAGAVLLTPYNP